MVKCGVCGSDNEPEALFCGTCGSPLTPAAQPAPTKPETATTSDDEISIPGKGGRKATPPDDVPEPPPPPDGGGAGTGTTTETVVTGGPTITCAVCGTVNEATRTYCRKCASELKPAAPPPPPPPPAVKPRRISPAMIGIAIVAVAAIAVIAVGASLLGGTPKPSASASASGPSSGPTLLASGTPAASLVPTASAPAFTEGDTPPGKIVYAKCPAAGGNCVLVMINADGSGKPRNLTGSDQSATDPDLSHDGTRVIYSSKAGLRIVNVETRKWTAHSTTAGDTNPAWSPDDSQIVFSGHRTRDPGSNDADLEIRLDGITVAGDSEPLTANAVMDHDGVWTPDGKKVIWVRGEGDDRELMMIDLATRDVTQLTNDRFNDVDPNVSPDGTQIVFSSKRGSTGTFDLFLMNLATREITALPTMDGDEHDPYWSPGGRYIVFSSGQPKAEDLTILDLADGHFIDLAKSADRELAPSWR